MKHGLHLWLGTGDAMLCAKSKVQETFIYFRFIMWQDKYGLCFRFMLKAKVHYPEYANIDSLFACRIHGGCL